MQSLLRAFHASRSIFFRRRSSHTTTLSSTILPSMSSVTKKTIRKIARLGMDASKSMLGFRMSMSRDKARLHGNDEPEALSMKDVFQLVVQ